MIKKITSEETIEERLFGYFPPPLFLNLKATGVDISDSSIKVLDIIKEKPDLLNTRNEKWIDIQFLHKMSGKIVLAQLAPETRILPPPLLSL